jgi:hypothetical protein
MSTWGGDVCEYISSSLFSDSPVTTQLLHLAAGQAVSWRVQFSIPSASTSRKRLAVQWRPHQGSYLKSLTVEAYRLGYYYDEEQYYSLFPPKEMCWTEVCPGTNYGWRILLSSVWG